MVKKNCVMGSIKKDNNGYITKKNTYFYLSGSRRADMLVMLSSIFVCFLIVNHNVKRQADKCDIRTKKRQISSAQVYWKGLKNRLFWPRGLKGGVCY